MGLRFEAAIIVLFVVGTIVGMVWLMLMMADLSCRTRAELMGLPYQYSPWTDCMIQVKGEWVPLGSYRATGEVGVGP